MQPRSDDGRRPRRANSCKMLVEQQGQSNVDATCARIKTGAAPTLENSPMQPRKSQSAARRLQGQIEPLQLQRLWHPCHGPGARLLRG